MILSFFRQQKTFTQETQIGKALRKLLDVQLSAQREQLLHFIFKVRGEGLRLTPHIR